jgi:cytochrome P450
MTILQIINNPKIHHKLLSEIHNYLKSNPSKASEHSIIPSSDARKLPYLQSCIREGLRIFPPFTGLNSKLVPLTGDTVNGRYIPGGTKIALGVWAMQRDPVFGEDTDVFVPERWLDVSKEQAQKMFTTMELVFGSGRYGCLGRAVAYIELDKVIFEVGFSPPPFVKGFV